MKLKDVLIALSAIGILNSCSQPVVEQVNKINSQINGLTESDCNINPNDCKNFPIAPEYCEDKLYKVCGINPVPNNSTSYREPKVEEKDIYYNNI